MGIHDAGGLLATSAHLTMPRPAGSLRGARVVIVQQALQMGGAERQGLLLAAHLAKNCRCDVQFWGLANPGEVVTACEQIGISCQLVPCEWSGTESGRMGQLLEFGRRLRAARPDVVLPFTNPPNVICGLTWRASGARTCIWNQRDVDKHHMGATWEYLATRLTPVFVSNSRHGAEFIAERYAVPTASIHVIYNGVELRQSLGQINQWRLRLGAHDDDFVACMVANIHEHKDHETVIRAWRVVVDHLRGRRRAVLGLAGHDYGSGSGLRDLAAELGIAQDVCFLDHVDDVSGLIEASNLCVFCAWREGVPNGVLECMIRGLPVTGSDIPGVREAVGEGGVQFLAAPGDVEGLARQILRFEENLELCKRIGDLNRTRVLETFSPERMCRDMERVIADSLSA